MTHLDIEAYFGRKKYAHRTVMARWGFQQVKLFDFGCVVKRDPSRAGFQPAPASRGTLPGFDLHDGKYAFSCKLTGLGIVRSRPFADIQVRNADLDKNGTSSDGAEAGPPGE